VAVLWSHGGQIGGHSAQLDAALFIQLQMKMKKILGRISDNRLTSAKVISALPILSLKNVKSVLRSLSAGFHPNFLMTFGISDILPPLESALEDRKHYVLFVSANL
jgi:hypothetical protein